jgi:hypothetical protein
LRVGAAILVAGDCLLLFSIRYREKQEVSVAKRGGYRSDKRRKETDRLKKQEEKRQRRFSKGREGEGEPEAENEEQGAAEDAELSEESE